MHALCVQTQCVGVCCELLKSIVLIQEATTSSHYSEGGESDIQPLDVLRLVTHLLSDLHFFVSLLQLIFFFTQWSDLALQRAAAQSQWRCRPKQPGLK